MCQLEIAHILNYITEEQLKDNENSMVNISRMLSG